MSSRTSTSSGKGGGGAIPPEAPPTRGRSILVGVAGGSGFRQDHGTVRPTHDRYVEPSRRHADVTIHEGGHNRVAIGKLVRRLESLVRATG